MIKYLIFIFLWCSVVGLCQTSRPSIQKLPYISCQESKVEFGVEGYCLYKTKTSEWEIGFYKEGAESRSLKNVVKNAVIVFHPSTNSFKLREWWDYMIGPGRALDTNENMFLSIGILGDGAPKSGNPEELSTDILLEAQLAVIDYVLPKSKFIVGGISLGGMNALLLAQKFPDRVKKVFTIAGPGSHAESEIKFADKLKSYVLKSELKVGPYANLNKKQKEEFWTNVLGEDESILNAYGKDFLKDRSSAEKLGYKIEDYQSADQFKDRVFRDWISWMVDTTDPLWHEEQIRLIHNSIAAINSKWATLPKEILIINFADDLNILPSVFLAFENLLVSQNKNVTRVEISDPRGHMTCCSINPPLQMVNSLRAFLKP